MTAINLPGQLEVPLVVDHQKNLRQISDEECVIFMARQIAKLLRQYEDRPTSETWSRIQALAKEILK